MTFTVLIGTVMVSVEPTTDCFCSVSPLFKGSGRSCSSRTRNLCTPVLPWCGRSLSLKPLRGRRSPTRRELPKNTFLPSRVQTRPSSEPPVPVRYCPFYADQEEVTSVGFMESDSLLGGTVREVYGSRSGSESAEDPVSRRMSDTGE